jgi:hypothetical protein
MDESDQIESTRGLYNIGGHALTSAMEFLGRDQIVQQRVLARKATHVESSSGITDTTYGASLL